MYWDYCSLHYMTSIRNPIVSVTYTTLPGLHLYLGFDVAVDDFQSSIKVVLPPVTVYTDGEEIYPILF